MASSTQAGASPTNPKPSFSSSWLRSLSSSGTFLQFSGELRMDPVYFGTALAENEWNHVYFAGEGSRYLKYVFSRLQYFAHIPEEPLMELYFVHSIMRRRSIHEYALFFFFF